ncbi:MAG: DoxX family protein [Pseudonocardiaceae bacterium]
MLLRRVARPLLAGIFIYGGIGALREPKPYTQLAEPVLHKMGNLAPPDRLPSSTTMVAVDAWTKIGAGTLLALGKFPRFTATALAASLIPTTLAGHRFWEVDDPQERSDQLIHFLKNLGLLGGLAIAAADTAGKPSLAWRGRRAARRAAAASQRKLAKAAAVADRTGGTVSGLAAGVTGKVSQATGEVAGTASYQGRKLAGKAVRLGEEAAGKAVALSEDVAGALSGAADEASGRVKSLRH